VSGNESLNLQPSEAKKLKLVEDKTADFFVIRLTESDFSSITLESPALATIYALKIHDFRSQAKGHENAESYPGKFLLPNSEFDATSIELYVRRIGANEPQMKIARLADNCDPENLVAFIWSEARSELGILCINTATEKTLPTLLIKFLEPDEAAPPAETPVAPTPTQVIHVLPPAERPARPDNSLNDETLLHELWARGSGGGLSAESPRGAMLPGELRGPWASGLDLASELFVKAVRNQSSSESPTSLFLIGGPGAGKSSFAKHILSELSVDVSAEDFSNLRSVDFEGSARFRLVNDATIKSANSDESLKEDIRWAESNKSHLFACANRGVIADESNLENMDDSSTHQEILNWLAQSDFGTSEDLVSNEGSSDYFRMAEHTMIDGTKRTLIAVYLDVCSLLAPLPQVSIEGSGLLVSQRQKLASVGQLGTQSRSQSPLGVLLASLALRLGEIDFESKYGLSLNNPLVHNCQILTRPDFQNSLLQGLRVGELVSETKVTYRLFWATLSKVIFGPIRELTSFEKLGEFARDLEHSDPQQPPIESQFEKSCYYAPLNLFTRLDSYTKSPSKPRDRVGDFWARLDPVRRSSADRLKLNDLFGKESAIELVMDAMKSVESGQSALKILPTQSHFSVPQSSRFFAALDESHSAPEVTLDDKQRASVASNYSQLLVRIGAFFSGEFACIEEAEVWISLASSVPAITSDDDLKTRFESLIKPKVDHADPSSPSMMPYLDSQLTPLRGFASNDPQLAVSLDNVVVQTVQVGPTLYLNLEEMGTPIGRIRCDFALIREALSSSPSSLGVTDQSGFVDPRLDRVRSTKLVSETSVQSPRLLVVKGTDTFEMKVEERPNG
jgi:hypothetical protein